RRNSGSSPCLVLLHASTALDRNRSRAVDAGIRRLLLDDREDVAGGEDQVLLTAVLHLGPAVLRVQDPVTDLDVNGNPLAGVVDAARPDSEDGALLRLLLRGVRDDDPRRRRGLCLIGLDQNPVLERPDRNLRQIGRASCRERGYTTVAEA